MKIKKLMVHCLIMSCILFMSPAFALTPEKVAIPRLVALSKQPTTESVNEVIALAQEGSTNLMRLQFVMTALIQMGASTAGDAYVKSILDDDNSAIMSVQGALGYLAARPKPSMTIYANKFLAATYSGETRSMAAYLAGKLGMSTTVNTIKEIISTSSYGNVRSQAAYGLAHLVPVAEFETTINATDLRGWDKTLAKQLNAFIQGDNASKEASMGSLLNRSEFIFPLAALRYLLETNNTELLKKYVVTGDETRVSIPNPAHQLFVRMLGYQITGDINNIIVSVKPLL